MTKYFVTDLDAGYQFEVGTRAEALFFKSRLEQMGHEYCLHIIDQSQNKSQHRRKIVPRTGASDDPSFFRRVLILYHFFVEKYKDIKRKEKAYKGHH